MIVADEIEEIIATYRKYGWILRRVLLTEDLNAKLEGRTNNLFENVRIDRSEMDAAWFSRPPQIGGVSWELRYLGDIPFALLEKIDEADPEFENILRDIEARLCDNIAAKDDA